MKLYYYTTMLLVNKVLTYLLTYIYSWGVFLQN